CGSPSQASEISSASSSLISSSELDMIASNQFSIGYERRFLVEDLIRFIALNCLSTGALESESVKHIFANFFMKCRF
ncbi:MAG: hypothetical protein EZS28_023033, partial [Streblomastix strix]